LEHGRPLKGGGDPPCIPPGIPRERPRVKQTISHSNGDVNLALNLDEDLTKNKGSDFWFVNLKAFAHLLI
jgi:hypothetical protein